MAKSSKPSNPNSLFNRIRNSHLFQRILRALQFLSAVISLGLFSSRFYKIYRLSRSLHGTGGAVEGILAAAVAYTIISLLISLLLKSGAPKIFRWLLIFFDLLFVGGFIAVAVLTRPNGGLNSLCATPAARQDPNNSNNALCRLPLGTFVLSILSTLLHMITAIFHEVRDHRRNSQQERLRKEELDEQNGGY